MGEFRRDMLPDAESFFEARGLALTGRGTWRTTRCEFHGGSDSMRINTATGGWRCMSCGAKGGDVVAYTMQVDGVGFIDAVKQLGACTSQRWDKRSAHASAGVAARRQQQPDRLRDNWLAFYRSCSPISGAGAAYLQARQCVPPPVDGHLRYRSSLRHHTGGPSAPALVALITDAITGEPISLHFTWVQPDGTKAPFEPARRYLAGHRKAGGVVRLWPSEAVTTGLAIAEGIETALSLAHAFTPVWACLDAGNLAEFPLLPGVESLLIAADNDDAGIRAAEACAERWTDAGREVRIAMADTAGADINDLVAA